MLMQILKYSLVLGMMIWLSKVAVFADEAACTDRPWACKDHVFLCEKATYISNGKVAWDYRPNGASFADGARQQGLTCQVGKVAQTQNKSSAVVTKKVTSAEMLRQDFNAQTVLIRKQIQYALRQLGYYDSAIDGIWGKRTRTAIMRFSERNNLTTYPPRRIYFEALELVDVPNSFADKPSRSTQKSSDECVSILSLLGIPLCNKNTDWNSTPVRRSSGVESCISDIDCEYPQKCIGSAGRRTCGTIVDQYGNRSTDPLSKPMTCISSSDCPASFRCDSTLRVCVR